MSAFDKERAALILVEATYFTDPKVAKNWGITRQTIGNYRKRLDSDEELVRIFTIKKKSLNKIGAMV